MGGSVTTPEPDMTEIGCHDPGCTDPADVLADDTMFGLTIAFCRDCLPGWRDVDHIVVRDGG